MSSRKPYPKLPPQPPPQKVTCADCRHFIRDTSGPSYNNDTHEYFMGVCGKGLTPDGCRKAFANKPRICQQYLSSQ